MKQIGDNVKNALKKSTTQRKGRILVNGTYYDVYNVEYYADAYDEGKVIGNAIASQLDFDIPYISKFDTFKYFDGVWTGNGYEYVDMGTFNVFDDKDEDEFTKHITAFDNLIKFNAPFVDKGGYPKTLYQELLNICSQAKVTLLNTSIPNGDFSVVNNQFVNGESLKTILKSICSITGTYATIKNDNLVLQLKNTTNEKIDKSQHEPVTWKRRSYGINQVIIGDSTIEGEYVIRQDDNDIALNGVHKLVIEGNLFAWTQEKRQQLIDGLFNQVRGFGYIPYELKGEWLNYLEVGDTINIDGTDTIVLRINGKSPRALESEMSAPAIIDSSIEYVDNTNDVENQLKRTEISVDKQNQKIESVVSQTNAQNQKIAQITQTVDELNSKISDIADITISAEDTDARIELNEINESEPIRIVVRPVGENISYLYPNENLFPSDNLYLKVRTIRFHNNTTGENIDYELPTDLLYYNSENYDEFILDYDAQSCVVNKKVGYNADGSTYVLSSPQTLEFAYPKIVLTEGDYIVSLLGYSVGYIFARLMSKNIYTTQFYTKAETDSKITQTTDSINFSVDKKLSNYSTTDEMNSAISIKANEITSNVSETYATKDTTNNLSSRITQNTNSITSEVSRATDVEGSLSSRITQTNDGLTSEVKRATNSESNLSSRIKQTATSFELATSDNGTSAGLTIKLKNEDGTQLDSKSANITMNGLVKFADLSGQGATTINGSNITTGTISANRLESKVITTDNFNAQQINANNITSGALNANRISGGTISASSIYLGNGAFSVSTTGAITSTSGTIGGWTIGSHSLVSNKFSNYSVGLYDASSSTGDVLVVKNTSNNSYPFILRANGQLFCDNADIKGKIEATSGSFTGKVTATSGSFSGSISIGDNFKVNSSGIATMYNGVGFITMNKSGNHPWLSGINVNRTNGISFRTGTTYGGSLGTEVGGINFDGTAMYINSNGTININHGSNGQIGGNVGICGYSIDGHTFTGQGGGKMYANSNCAFLPASGYYAYVGSASNATHRIVTASSGPSSLNVKENLEEIDTKDVYKDIQNLKLYNYDYKYKGVSVNQHDFGFIIDYVEKLPTLSKFAKHYDTKYYIDKDKKELAKIWDEDEIDGTREVLDVKEWDRDSYIKMSMVMIKALQEKIDTLENKIKELENKE